MFIYYRDELYLTKRAGASEESTTTAACEHGDAGAVARDERDECQSNLGACAPPGRDLGPVLLFRSEAVRVLVSGAS